MRTHWFLAAAVAVGVLSAWPARAADPKKDTPKAAEPKKDKGPLLRYQHAYEAAVQESRERGCVIFATFHIDH